MDIPVDVWVRGENDATTANISGVDRAPVAWTESDVTLILIGMLRALDRARNPGVDPERPMVLRGFSWIVNPFEAGGVVIAMEMTVGAVVAGPFDTTEDRLSAMIQRVMDADRASVQASGTDTVH